MRRARADLPATLSPSVRARETGDSRTQTAGGLLDSLWGFVYGRGIVPRRRGLGALAVGVLVAGGCGPIEYLSQVRGRAALAMVQAERQGAPRLAPYEYTAASEYLRKAREEAGRSSFQLAIEYGRRSEELANRAAGIARERAHEEGADAGAAPPSGVTRSR